MPVSPDLDRTPEVVRTDLMQESSADSRATANSLPQLQLSVAQGRLRWRGPLVLVMGRTALIVLAQGLVATIFLLRGTPHPWLAAAPWWTIYGTLVDVGCLTLLWWYTRGEGITIRDLMGTIRLRYGRDLFLGLGILIVVFPLFVAGGLLSCRLIYGAYRANVFPGILGGRILPLWAAIYSRSLWWLIWSPTEEMTYAGYVLPRAQALSHRTWVALLLVGLFWSIQHSFLPFIPEWRNFLWRFLAFIPGVIALMLFYLRIHRLAPLIVAHWIMDIVATTMTMG